MRKEPLRYFVNGSKDLAGILQSYGARLNLHTGYGVTVDSNVYADIPLASCVTHSARFTSVPLTSPRTIIKQSLDKDDLIGWLKCNTIFIEPQVGTYASHSRKKYVNVHIVSNTNL
jgi:hypothetical protein